MTDTTNFRGSSNLLEVATRVGLWDEVKQGSLVDFTAAFGLDRGVCISKRETMRLRGLFPRKILLCLPMGLRVDVSNAFVLLW